MLEFFLIEVAIIILGMLFLYYEIDRIDKEEEQHSKHCMLDAWDNEIIERDIELWNKTIELMAKHHWSEDYGDSKKEELVMNINETIKDYLGSLQKAEISGRIIGEKICDAVREIIPDIKFSLGWEEAGIDTICFYSKEFSSRIEGKHFDWIVGEVFPELEFHVDAPFGIRLTNEEAKLVKKKLEELRKSE